MECEFCGQEYDYCDCYGVSGYDTHDSLRMEMESDLMWEWDS